MHCVSRTHEAGYVFTLVTDKYNNHRCLFIPRFVFCTFDNFNNII